MNKDEVKRLEEECERALDTVVHKHVSHRVPPRTRHLMAKAAVLEAVLDAQPQKD